MKYLIRLDDACETMNLKNWLRIEAIFDKYQVKPLVAVIPNNEDSSQLIDPPYKDFWLWVKQLEQKGWEIGLHGYNHIYVTKEGGINPIHKRSEFAGLPLKIQSEKIKKGILKMAAKGFCPNIFVAPSHTFDLNTLEALKNNSEIKIISDTMALFPYKKYGFTFIPQQIGAVRPIWLPGLYTFCYHPNTMSDLDFVHLDRFLSKNHTKFTSFNQLNLKQVKPKTWFDKLLSFAYFKFRKIFR